MVSLDTVVLWYRVVINSAFDILLHDGASVLNLNENDGFRQVGLFRDQTVF